MISIVYCTATSPVLLSLKIGAQSGSGVSPITIPEAWSPVFLMQPSSLSASSKSFVNLGSSLYGISCPPSGIFSVGGLKQSLSLAFGLSGTQAFSMFTSLRGISRIRPTSAIQFFGLRVPNVTMCPTFSGWYKSWVCLMMSCLKSKSMSTSKSGIETRSGLRNRSKISPNLKGSMSVIPMQYATREPAPEPRPGPIGMYGFFTLLTLS